MQATANIDLDTREREERSSSYSKLHTVRAKGQCMSAVQLVEVAPRDGLQNESAILSTADKVRLVEHAIASGVRRIEAVSFVNPTRVPQMADAEAVMAALPRVDGVLYSGLVLNQRGLDRALAAGVDEINVVVVATDEFSRRNQGCTTAEGVQRWADLAARARAA